VESNQDISLPIEPYEVAALEYGDVTLGFSTHLAGGEVSLFRIDDNGKLAPELLSVVDGVVPGASGIAVNHVNREIYVSGRHDPTPHVAVMKVLTDSANGSYVNNPYFDDVGSISLYKDMYAGTDARGLAVSSSGETALLVTRLPEALLKIDTESRELIDMTTLGADPSLVALFEEDNGNLDPTDDIATAFVLCFLSDQVYIVDPEIMQVHVRTTGFGPHAIAFDKTRQRAYIANFRESTITIIETVWPYNQVGALVTDPEDPQRQQTATLKIGIPRLPKDHS
jgi:DNA-binding beta-propeller fold protein YncE